MIIVSIAWRSVKLPFGYSTLFYDDKSITLTLNFENQGNGCFEPLTKQEDNVIHEGPERRNKGFRF